MTSFHLLSVFLQEILHGMKFDPADYVIANLKTFHTYVSTLSHCPLFLLAANREF
jgi:hypothetical protein